MNSNGMVSASAYVMLVSILVQFGTSTKLMMKVMSLEHTKNALQARMKLPRTFLIISISATRDGVMAPTVHMNLFQVNPDNTIFSVNCGMKDVSSNSVQIRNAFPTKSQTSFYRMIQILPGRALWKGNVVVRLWKVEMEFSPTVAMICSRNIR